MVRQHTLEAPPSASVLSSVSAIGAGGSLRFSKLPPFLRVLLVTDGTVTRSVEADFAEPIDVRVLLHAEDESDRCYPELNVLPGDPVLRRYVALNGRITGTIYVLAQSTIVLACIDSKMRLRLLEQQRGIGELLHEAKCESYRELLSLRTDKAGAWAQHLAVPQHAPVVIRNYTIRRDGRAAAMVQEVFPERRFQ